MKKSNANIKNKLLVGLYFLSSLIWLGTFESSLVTNSIGLAFIIATAYGVVCISKKVDFLF